VKTKKYIRYQKIHKKETSFPADLLLGDGYGFDMPVQELINYWGRSVKVEDDPEKGWERLYITDSQLERFAKITKQKK
jgi:hypothetical protein